MTQEDVSKLTKAMKDPQFRGYLDEYCKEISDPGNRKEYLQYLAQLEAKGELPEGQALLRCDPGVCVKTSIRFKNGQVQKCFFNIVHSDRLDDLALKGSEKGGGGQNVHLPYSLSPPRTERDHKDDYCMVCDMAISTGTFMQSVQNPQILKMLVDIAADGLSSKFLQSHEEVSKDFKLLKKVKCKGGEPMPMSVKSELLKGSKKPTKPVDTGGFDGVTPSELKQMKDDAKKKKEAAKKKQKDEQGDGAEEVERKPAAEEKAPPRIRVPKHRLIHSGTVDLADYMSTSEEKSVGPTSTVPKLLKLIVELPTVKKSSDISLEVTSNNVVIEVPGKYYLDLPLSYEIEDSHGTAKFDKAQQTLTLELPVVPKAPDPNTSPFEPAPLAEDDGGLRDGDASSEEEEAPAPASQLAEKNYFRGAKMKEELEQIESELAGSEAPAAMDAGTAPAPGEEQPPPLAKKNELLELEPCGGSLRFADPQLTSSGEAGATEEAAALQSLGAEDDSDMLAEGPAFIAAEKFEGAKAGYYFGLADQGLGYYRDLRQPTRKRAQVAPAAADTRPSALIEEVAALSAEQEQELAPARPPLPADLQRYLDATSACTTRVAAGDREACDVQGELPLDWDQSRQNLSLFISTLPKHRVSDVQLRLAGQVMTVTICTRPEGDSEQLWQRHCIRQKLCGLVDPRQWHAEVVDGTVTITVRKVDPVGMWTQIVDSTVSLPPEAPPCDTSAAPTDKGACSEADGKGSRMPEEPTQPVVSSVGCSIADAVDVDSSELDVAAPVAQGSTSKDMAKTVVGSSQFQAKATAAMVQSATVMGQGVLLRNRFMYELM
jgi:dynein assembly factor 2